MQSFLGTKSRLILLIVISMISTLIFASSAVCATEVSIHNDLDKQIEGKMLEVDHIVIDDIPKSKFRLTIYPEELKQLAAGPIKSFIVSRIFPTHKLKYDVSCKKSNEKLILTLSQIHENKMGELCTLKKFGHWSKRTGLKWIKM